MPTDTTTQASPAIIAELNDLLQLDHDAVQSYSLAIEQVEHPAYKETLRRYRADHERHVTELTTLIREHGGLPFEFPHPTGVAKLAKQGTGALGGDKLSLLAFRENERQARDKYARAAAKADAWPADIQAVVRRGAADESRHYDWVDTTLHSLGVTDDTPLGRSSRIMETVHARTADAIEAVGKQGMRGFEAARQQVPRAVSAVRGSRAARVVRERPGAVALAAVGIGLLTVAAMRGGRSSRSRA